MGFFDRIWNVIKGIFAGTAADIERRNPEAVYESAIEERVKKYAELKKAVSGIVYLRNKIAADLETKEKELKDVLAQLPIAIEEGEDEAALVLIQKKDELTKQIADLKTELEKLATQAEEAKKGLVAFTGEIEKLKREKVEMLARKQTAEARITIQETLDGLSTDADIKALDTVREHIHKLQAEADVGSEIKGESLDAKLEKIKAKAVDAGARAQLEEMKKQAVARKTASEAAATAAGGSDPGRRTI